MYCPNCGNLIDKGSLQCPHCLVHLRYHRPLLTEKNAQSERVHFGKDGAYHWTYRFNLLKNPLILLTLWKILLYVWLGIELIACVFIALNDGVDEVLDLVIFNPQSLIVPGILLVLSVLGYGVMALMYGGHYQVYFSLDEQGITHEVKSEQQRRVSLVMRIITLLITLLAFMTRKPGLIGPALLVRYAQRVSFEKVRSVKEVRWCHAIKVNELFEHAQVYAHPEDYAWLLFFISSHCPRLKPGRTSLRRWGGS